MKFVKKKERGGEIARETEQGMRKRELERKRESAKEGRTERETDI